MPRAFRRPTEGWTVTRAVVSTWYGTYLVDGTEVVRSVLAPASVEELASRARTRQSGGITLEEEELLSERGPALWSSRDRRLADRGLRWDPHAPALPPGVGAPDRERQRLALLTAAEVALAASWDPSIHVEEAVRAASDLDRAANLVGERLISWASRDAPDLDPGDPASAARRVLGDETEGAFGPADPAIREARRRFADLYRAIEMTRAELTSAVKGAVPERTPNLSALLGPDLAARLLAQARGLDRLARLPASTIQVLGAEKAFFEHLRGRAPPPRHGLLFLHAAIQSASRLERGRLARTLAGKVAIAARLDRAGKPLDPALLRAFEARRTRLKEARGRGRVRPRRTTSAQPLHAATGDR
jgi:nucleolar protein 56